MSVSPYSIVMAVLWSNVFIVLLYLCCRSTGFISRLGVSSVGMIAVCCILRFALPIEFAGTIIIPSYNVYAGIVDWLKTPLFFGRSTGTILVTIWALGIILSGSYLTVQYRRTAKRLNMASTAYQSLPPFLEQLLLKRKIKQGQLVFKRCSAIQIPMIMGFFTHTVYIPESNYTEAELTHIVLHELVHYQRKDVWKKLVAGLYCIVFWWNPFTHLLKNNLTQVLELTCDQQVTKDLSPEETVIYAETLLTAMKLGFEEKQITPYASAQLSSAKGAHQIRQRFLLLLQTQKHPSHMLLCTWTLILVIGFCGSFLFVVQPRYVAPINEIVTNDWVDAVPDNSYLVRDAAGKYILYVSNEEPFQISYSVAIGMIDNGFPIIYAEGQNNAE